MTEDAIGLDDIDAVLKATQKGRMPVFPARFDNAKSRAFIRAVASHDLDQNLHMAVADKNEKGFDGRYTRYFSVLDVLIIDEHYKDGQRHGPSKVFYPNGTLFLDRHFYEGKPEGESKTYDHKGQLSEQEHYHAGQLHGLSQKFNENGKMVDVTVYDNGHMDMVATRKEQLNLQG